MVSWLVVIPFFPCLSAVRYLHFLCPECDLGNTSIPIVCGAHRVPGWIDGWRATCYCSQGYYGEAAIAGQSCTWCPINYYCPINGSSAIACPFGLGTLSSGRYFVFALCRLLERMK
jgi:hypothetical protein